jgi:tripartite ATP-independent transporter DctM subunit
MMGFFTLVGGFGGDLYHSASKWLGHMKGGLSMATVSACALFSAIDGDSVASTATMSAVALPEMRKYGYNDVLSTGAIIAGGNLGPIIPPSVMFIIYGLLTRVSIGDLYMAGIIPGILMAVVFCLTILVWVRINSKLAPPAEKSTWGARIKSLWAIGPIAVLFLLVVGGIYTGVFTPTECGAIGTVGVVAFALLMRRLTWGNFRQGLLDGGKVISTIFLIVIGAGLFTRFIAWTNLSVDVTRLFLNIPSHFLVISILVIFFILGFFMDILPLMMIGVPIVHPIAVATGADPLWFAMLLCMVINAGSITPPIGINMFVIKSIQKDIPMGVIFKGAMPFVYGSVAAIVALYIWPALVTWLPGVLK